jgi:TonB family protein
MVAAPATVMPVDQAKKDGLLLAAPFPDYSFEARRQRLEGSGIFELKFDFASGHLREIHVVRSTGHALLDSSCIRAFKQWKAKPRSLHELRTPATFTIAR